jgi:hypothetical protein
MLTIVSGSIQINNIILNMTIEQLILILEEKSHCGFEITKRKGILTSTWEIYKKGDLFYFFDVSEKIVFDENHKYIREELIEEFKNSHFSIDCEFY